MQGVTIASTVRTWPTPRDQTAHLYAELCQARQALVAIVQAYDSDEGHAAQRFARLCQAIEQARGTCANP
jgi:hypothetical protein